MNNNVLERLLRLWIYILNPLAIFCAYQAHTYRIDCMDYDNECWNIFNNFILASLVFLLSPLIFLLLYYVIHIVWTGNKPNTKDIKLIAIAHFKNNAIYIALSLLIAFTLIFNTSYEI